MTTHARIITLVIATIAAITLSSTQATAQPFIEIGAIGGGDNSDVYIRAIFDTSAPRSGPKGLFVFDAIFAEVTDIQNRISDQPFRISTPLDAPRLEVEATLHYSEDQYSIVFTDAEGVRSFITVNETNPAFTPHLLTLPDDPSEYLADASSQDAFISVAANNGNYFGFWTLDNGFTSGGAFSLWVQLVEDPNNPNEPCLVDLNNDGALDFFDISTFLTIFGAGCP